MSSGAGWLGAASHHYMYATDLRHPLYFRLPFVQLRPERLHEIFRVNLNRLLYVRIHVNHHCELGIGQNTVFGLQMLQKGGALFFR